MLKLLVILMYVDKLIIRVKINLPTKCSFEWY